jgi:2-haloacid dehalogenase
MTRSDAPWTGGRPTVLVFDVNETLLDLESMRPLFERVFGDGRVLREWFGQLILYSMTVTLSDLYEDFFSLGQGLFEMVGAIHDVRVGPADLEALREGMLTMPAHPDVMPGLRMLKDAGFRMATLTNSPPSRNGKSPLENAGLAGFFERRFSVDTARAYKPAQVLYHKAAQDLEVSPSACCMIAAHVWDTIGAQSAGFAAGLLTRLGNAPLLVPGLPQPNFVAPNLPALAAEMIKMRRS